MGVYSDEVLFKVMDSQMETGILNEAQIKELLNDPKSKYREKFKKRYADTYWVHKNHYIEVGNPNPKTWNIYCHVKKITEIKDNGYVLALFDTFQEDSNKTITVSLNETGYAHIHCIHKKITRAAFLKAKTALIKKLKRL